MEKEPKKVICATHGEIGEVDETWKALVVFEEHRKTTDGCMGMKTEDKNESNHEAVVGFNLP
jgi:hypothetical protein